MFLLDTNATSDIFKGRSTAARLALAHARGENVRIAISVLTRAEILFGLQKRLDAQRFREAFEAFTFYVEVLPWDDAAAHSYAYIRSSLLHRHRDPRQGVSTP